MISPRTAKLRRTIKVTDLERNRAQWRDRQRRHRELAQSGKVLTLKFHDYTVLIDKLVKERWLTEGEVENPAKLQAELIKLIAELEEGVMEKLR